MKTVDDIERKLFNADNRVERINILREYAESIVDACAGNFECTMEDDIEYVGTTSDGRDNYQIVGEYPVLVRASVEAVKKQIV